MRYKYKIILFSSIIFIILIYTYFIFISDFFNKETTLEDIYCIDCNIILISLDTLRADHMSLYGYDRNTSPNIDNFAKESVVFNKAFSNGYFTLAGHMSIFTSLYPLKNKMNSLPTKPLSKNFTTLVEVLQQNNYKTTWIAPLYDNNLDLTMGFERGFDKLNKPIISRSNSFDKEFFSEIIVENKNDKFFLFIHSYINHAPYIYPEEFTYKFSNPDYDGDLPNNRLDLLYIILNKLNKTTSDYVKELSMTDETKQEFLEILNSKDSLKYDKFLGNSMLIHLKTWDFHPQYYYFETVNSEVDINELRNRYDNGVFFIDYIIGELLFELKRNNLMNNTIIIITSDHGEQLLENGDYDHSTFYDHTIHVPLIIYVPGFSQGFESNSLVQGIDIMPTILNLVKINPPDKIQGKNILISNEVNYYVFGYSFNDKYIRSQEWKYIIKRNGLEKLYYLVEDPLEQNNLINSTIPFIIEKNKELIEALEKWTLEQII